MTSSIRPPEPSSSEYLLQVLHAPTGQVVYSWAPGLAAERLLVEEIVARVVAKGVGVGRTSSHVAADVRAAVRELLFELKSEVR